MQSRTTAAESFRHAVSAGAYLEAEMLLGAYCREVEDDWKTATSDSERRAISTEVTAILAWARTVTLSARSHTQRKLILLNREGAYARSIPKNTVRDLEA